jgi:hypothetical protein
MNECLQAILHEHLPKNLFFASKLGQCGKPVRDVIRKIALEHGQQTLSHPRSHAADVEVGRVVPPPLANFLQVLAQNLAPLAKQRPDNGARLGMNAGKSSGACPAEQVRKHCFRLIVLCVRNGDPVGFALCNQPLKKGVSQPSAGVFQVPLVFRGRPQDIAALNCAFHSQPVRQLNHKLSVPIRLRASQAVIEMDHQ